MCGIAGVTDWHNDGDNSELVQLMCDCMRERGPDDAGLYVAPNVILGHTRLSIIDLSEHGHGPMCNEDETVWLTFNGEIYNFKVLREQLEGLGHHFRSTTDTEVVIHGYEEWGVNVLQKLNGMFAFGLWDSHKQILLLARDPIGEKPLFYYSENSRTVFASSINAVLKGLPHCPSLNLDAIDSFLCGVHIPTPLTIFRDIRKLPAGHFLLCSSSHEKLHKFRDFECLRDSTLKEEDWLEELDLRLRESVKVRLVADVPVGAFLSGGVDSSTVVALMSILSNCTVNTFSVGYDEPGFHTELPYALQVSEKYGTVHSELKFSALEAASIIPELIWQYGEPFGDASAIPTFFVSKRARESVKVVLTGDGGDELFGGYPRVRAIDLAVRYRQIVPHFIRQRIVPKVSNWMGERFAREGIISKIQTMSAYGRVGPESAFIVPDTWLDFRQAVYTSDFYNALTQHPSDPYRNAFCSSTAADDQTRALYADLRTTLPDNMLVKVDVASMTASIETRAPFLDNALIDFAFRMPFNLKLRKNETKYILKKLASRYIPKEVIYRRKQGFDLPLNIWFRNQLRPLVTGILLDQRTLSRGYIQPRFIETIVSEHLSGLVDHTTRIWLLLVLELWFRMSVEGTISRTSQLV